MIPRSAIHEQRSDSADRPRILHGLVDHIEDAALIASLSMFLIGIACAGAFLGTGSGPTPEVAARDAVYSAEYFHPEPRERAAYFVGLACLAVVPVALAFLLARRTPTLGRSRPRIRALFVAVGTGLCLASAASSPTYLDPSPVRTGLAIAIAAGLVGIALLRPKLRLAVPSVALGLLVAALVPLETVFNESFVSDRTWAFSHHFNTFFSPVAQVCAGRTLLVDLVDTYGLYPHFLEPFARAVRPSLLGITAILSALTAAAFLALLRTVWSVIRRPWLALLVFVSIVYWSALHWRLGWTGQPPDTWDPYFQMLPLRILFPCFALLALWRRLARGTSRAPWGLAAWCAAGVLWNPDSGLPALAAVLTGVAFQEWAGRGISPTRLVRTLLPFAVMPVLAFGVYAVFTLLRASRFPDYGMLFAAPRLFYEKGFMMLPMTLPHSWMLVALVYVVAASSSALRLVRGLAGPIDAFVAACAALGALLFAYFQGRSVDSNLAAVSYPAILITGIVLDRVLELPFGKAGPSVAWLTVLLLGWFAYSPAILAIRFPDLIATTSRAAALRTDAPLRTAERFLERYVRPGSEALFLSQYSWYFHFGTRTRSPLLWSALSEIVLRRDFDEIGSLLASGRFPVVAVDRNFLEFPYGIRRDAIDGVVAILTREYRPVAASPDGRLALCQRRALQGSTRR